MAQLAHFPSTHTELSLHAYVAAPRLPQLLRFLSGVTGMSPEAFLQHHLLFKPARRSTAPQAGELFYLQLVARVPEDADAGTYRARAQRWAMRLEDLPEVIAKPYTSRRIHSANTGQGDVIEFTQCLGYT